MTSTPEPNSSGDPGYRLLLPTPEMVEALADGAAGAASNEVRRVLAELETINGPVPSEQVAIICDRIVTEFAVADTVATDSAAPGPEGRGPIYDVFFAVDRLPASAGKDTIIRALAVALAVVIKNTVALEAGTSGVSPVEFGLLRQAFATIVEALRELSTQL